MYTNDSAVSFAVNEMLFSQCFERKQTNERPNTWFEFKLNLTQQRPFPFERTERNFFPKWKQLKKWNNNQLRLCSMFHSVEMRGRVFSGINLRVVLMVWSSNIIFYNNDVWLVFHSRLCLTNSKANRNPLIIIDLVCHRKYQKFVFLLSFRTWNVLLLLL